MSPNVQSRIKLGTIAIGVLVLTCIAGGMWWVMTGDSPQADVHKQNLDPDRGVYALADFENGDAARRNLIVDHFWLLAAQKPRLTADLLPGWIDSLMRDGRYADVRGLALVAELQKTWDVRALAVYQRAIVDALLAQKFYPQAVIEAKRAYHLSSPQQTNAAADLLARCMSRARGDRAGAAFWSDAAAFREIDASNPKLQEAIDRTRHGSRYPFENQLTQGNLLLLSDRPAEALAAFTEAAKHANQEDQRATVLESIFRAVRGEDGSAARARMIFDQIRSGQTTHVASLDSALVDPSWQAVAARIDLDAQDAEPFVVAEAILPAAEPARVDDAFDLPAQDPILLARFASQMSPDLRSWLDGWQENPTAVADAARRQSLLESIRRSPLPMSTLLKMDQSFRLLGGDSQSSALWLDEVVRKVSPEIADWCHRQPQGVEASEAERIELADMLARSPAGCADLVTLHSLYRTVSGDAASSAVIARAAIVRGDADLRGHDAWDDNMRQTLTAMKLCEASLWEQVNQGRHVDIYMNAIDLLCHNIDSRVPEKDSAFGWSRFWAKIGMSAAQTQRGEYTEAIATLDRLRQAGEITDNDQAAELAWARALALSHLDKPTETLAELDRVVAYPAFKHYLDALRLKSFTLATLKREDDARQTAAVYLGRATLNPLELAVFNKTIEEALIR
jgi:hypothetical protein